MVQNTWYTATSGTGALNVYQFTDSLNNLRSLHSGSADPEGTSGTVAHMLWANTGATPDRMDIRNVADDDWWEGPDIDKDGWGLIHWRDSTVNTATPSGATARAVPFTDGVTTVYIPAYAAEWT